MSIRIISVRRQMGKGNVLEIVPTFLKYHPARNRLVAQAKVAKAKETATSIAIPTFKPLAEKEAAPPVEVELELEEVV
jgi:hypothetical protein